MNSRRWWRDWYLLYFKSVVKGSGLQIQKFYARASRSVAGHVYIRVPEALSTGVRMSYSEAAAFHELLGRAIEEAKKPIPGQTFKITYADGSVEFRNAKPGVGGIAKVEILS